MTKRLTRAALIFSLAVPVAAWACEGHDQAAAKPTGDQVMLAQAQPAPEAAPAAPKTEPKAVAPDTTAKGKKKKPQAHELGQPKAVQPEAK